MSHKSTIKYKFEAASTTSTNVRTILAADENSAPLQTIFQQEGRGLGGTVTFRARMGHWEIPLSTIEREDKQERSQVGARHVWCEDGEDTPRKISQHSKHKEN